MEDHKGKLDSKIKRRIKAAAVLMAALSLIACGSAETEIATNSARPANTHKPGNSNAVSVETSNAETFNANVQSLSNRRLQRLEQMRTNSTNTSEKPAPLTARPAAENSEITVELRDVARETRTFRDHSTISRVERVSNGSQSAVFVTLRDGRRVEIPSSSVQSVEKITTAELLRLVEAENNRSAQTTRPQGPKKREQ